MRKVNLIVIHCSDSDNQAHDNIETIRKWHVQERGWKDVGYHYFIRKDGTVHAGRSEDVIGAHVAGHNRGSLGICLSGRNLFTSGQMESLGRLCRDLTLRYGLEKKDIVAHNDLDPGKTCPNFDLHALIASWSWH